MTALGANQVAMVYKDGLTDRVALYALRNITTGDTFDVSAEFTLVKRNTMMGTTVAGIGSGAIANSTQITIPAGLSGDAGWALVYGCANG
jgi:hypothetical protein